MAAPIRSRLSRRSRAGSPPPFHPMKTAILQAIVIYAIAGVISLFVALLIKGLFLFLQRRSR